MLVEHEEDLQFDHWNYTTLSYYNTIYIAVFSQPLAIFLVFHFLTGSHFVVPVL